MYKCAECGVRVLAVPDDETGELVFVRICGHEDSGVIAVMSAQLRGQGGVSA